MVGTLRRGRRAVRPGAAAGRPRPRAPRARDRPGRGRASSRPGRRPRRSPPVGRCRRLPPRAGGDHQRAPPRPPAHAGPGPGGGRATTAFGSPSTTTARGGAGEHARRRASGWSAWPSGPSCSAARSRPVRGPAAAGPSHADAPPPTGRRHDHPGGVADDQDIVRTGLRMILDAQPDIEVVGEAANGREAVELARRLRPDVCLFDIRMPEIDGIEATRQLAGPDVDDPLAVVVITTFDLDEYVHGALKAGARGFLLKDAGPELLAQAMHAAATRRRPHRPERHRPPPVDLRRARASIDRAGAAASTRSPTARRRSSSPSPAAAPTPRSPTTSPSASAPSRPTSPAS